MAYFFAKTFYKGLPISGKIKKTGEDAKGIEWEIPPKYEKFLNAVKATREFFIPLDEKDGRARLYSVLNDRGNTLFTDGGRVVYDPRLKRETPRIEVACPVEFLDAITEDKTGLKGTTSDLSENGARILFYSKGAPLSFLQEEGIVAGDRLKGLLCVNLKGQSYSLKFTLEALEFEEIGESRRGKQAAVRGRFVEVENPNLVKRFLAKAQQNIAKIL